MTSSDNFTIVSRRMRRTPLILITVGLILMSIAVFVVAFNSAQAWRPLIEGSALAFLTSGVTSFFYERHLISSNAEVIQFAARKIVEEVTTLHKSYIPQEVFENERSSRRFTGLLNLRVKESDVYRYRGDAARTTSFQISEIWLKESHYEERSRSYRLLLLNPKHEKPFEQKIYFERRRKPGSPEITPRDLEDEIKKLIQDVYVTIYLLHRAANKKEGADISVAFYSDVPFYRCEIVQNGLFITYYTKGQYAGTFLHDHRSLSYQAFSAAFDTSFNSADSLNLKGLSNHALEEKLKELGCQYDAAYLEERVAERIHSHSSEKALLSQWEE